MDTDVVSFLSNYDYAVIGFYFVFMVAIGFVFRSFVNDTSDYFRGGGKMSWWMTGSSAFMVQFSAWTFTGAASKAYEDGTLIFVIFFANAIGFLINYLYFAGLIAVLPNAVSGRLAFAFCGSVLLLIGLELLNSSNKKG